MPVLKTLRTVPSFGEGGGKLLGISVVSFPSSTSIITGLSGVVYCTLVFTRGGEGGVCTPSVFADACASSIFADAIAPLVVFLVSDFQALTDRIPVRKICHSRQVPGF